MSESLTTIPTDFFTDDGWLASISLPSHPSKGDEVVIKDETYVVVSKKWDLSTSGFPLLVRIMLD